MQHEITLGGDAPRSMLAGLRLQVEALEALGQTSAGGVDPRVECARRLQALANRSDTHPHNKDRRSTFGRQGSESEVSLDDKRTLLSRGNSKQSVESTASNRSRRSDRSGPQTPHNNDEAKSEPGSEGMLSPSEKPSMRTSLESRLDLFNTVLATHARKENESKKVQAELTGDGEPNACTIDPQSPFRIGWDLTTAIFLVYVAFWEPFNLGYVGECARLDISHAVFNKMMDASVPVCRSSSALQFGCCCLYSVVGRNQGRGGSGRGDGSPGPDAVDATLHTSHDVRTGSSSSTSSSTLILDL
jgi:hypothetical protein